MNGTEKQVKYGNDLREKAIIAIDEMISMNQSWFKKHAEDKQHYVTVKETLINFTGYAGNMILACNNRLWEKEIDRLMDDSTKTTIVWKDIKNNK